MKNTNMINSNMDIDGVVNHLEDVLGKAINNVKEGCVMAYVVYLGELLFPVTPSKITAKIKGQNKTASLIDGSQINMLKPPALAEISFDALIPQQPYHFAMYENSAVIPKSYKKVLKKKDFQEGYKGNGYLKPDYFFAWLEVLKCKKR